jgi:hypothetical protein
MLNLEGQPLAIPGVSNGLSRSILLLAPSEQQVREQLAKILKDRALGPNERLRLFLAHVVDRTLKGRQSEIK